MMPVRTTSVTSTAYCNGVGARCRASVAGTATNVADAREIIREQGFKIVNQSMIPRERVYCPTCERARQSLIRAGVLDCTGRVLDSEAFGLYVDQIAKPEQVSA